MSVIRQIPTSGRHKILRAATLQFADKGYDGASIREIAAVAHVHVSQIYQYFADKRALYEEVVAEAFDHDSMDYVKALESDDDTRTRLVNCLRIHLAAISENRPERRVIDRLILETGEDFTAIAPPKYTFRWRAGMKKLVTELQTRARRHEAWEEIARIILAMPYTVRYRKIRERGSETPENTLDGDVLSNYLADFIIHGLTGLQRGNAARVPFDRAAKETR